MPVLFHGGRTGIDLATRPGIGPVTHIYVYCTYLLAEPTVSTKTSGDAGQRKRLLVAGPANRARLRIPRRDKVTSTELRLASEKGDSEAGQPSLQYGEDVGRALIWHQEPGLPSRSAAALPSAGEERWRALPDPRSPKRSCGRPRKCSPIRDDGDFRWPPGGTRLLTGALCSATSRDPRGSRGRGQLPCRQGLDVVRLPRQGGSG